MKKILSVFTFFIATFLLQAQQSADTVYVVVDKGPSWTSDPHTWLGVIFVVATLILVIRTFRNKAEV